jgi:hypothetical protein
MNYFEKTRSLWSSYKQNNYFVKNYWVKIHKYRYLKFSVKRGTQNKKKI